jgi:site-specific DNA recombinase
MNVATNACLATAASPRRIVTYERVSSEDQKLRETIKTQTEEIARRLDTSPDVLLVDRYVDDGVSGTIFMAKRPAGARLLADAAEGRFDEVWVYSVDRLGRGWVDPEVVWEELEKCGVRIYSVSEEVGERLIYHIMAGLAAKKRVDFLRITADGLTRAAREGRYCGGIAPYGYKVDGHKNGAHLVPAEELTPGAIMSEADVVRHVYRRRALDDWNCLAIAEELTALGIPTKYIIEGRAMRKVRTQGRWGAGRIATMLRNTVYRGEQQFGKRSTRVREIISAPVPALVSEDLWYAAQEALARNSRLARNTERVYLLRGIVICGGCGRTFCGSQNHGETWLRCNGTLNRTTLVGERCQAKVVKGAHLEPVVWSDIERFLRDPGDILAELEAEAESDPVREALAAERTRWEGALREWQSRRERLLDMYQNSFISKAEFEERLLPIEEGRTQAQQHLDALTEQEDEVAPEPIPADLLAEIHRRLDEGLTDAERAEIVRLLVRKITVFTHVNTEDGRKTQRAVIEYRFPGGSQTDTGTGSLLPRE